MPRGLLCIFIVSYYYVVIFYVCLQCSLFRFAAILNRNRLFPWTTRMESHLDTLKNGSNVHASDQWLCTLIQLQRIIEEASISLDLFDVRPSKELDDPRTKYTLNNLRQQLETWKNSACNLKDDRKLSEVCKSSVYLMFGRFPRTWISYR